jgi:hypothetical protein
MRFRTLLRGPEPTPTPPLHIAQISENRVLSFYLLL